MTSVDKQIAADFLDTAGDFLGLGYKSARKEYNFEDDAPPAAQMTTAGNVRSDSIVQSSSIVQSGSIVDTLEQIAEEIRECRNCGLWKNRTNAAPGEGVERPLVMVIGEGPGAEEDAQGRPFVGKAGQLLDKMLSSINLSRTTNCFIANVIKCRPPFNRDPHPEETAACAGFLERQILLLKPKFILIAGRVCAQTLLKTNEPIGRMRGRFMELAVQGSVFPLLITYHPAALLRNEELKRPAWEDLKIFRSRIEKG